MKLLRMPLHTQIVIAIVLGVSVGLFFGEMAAAFDPLGDAFIMLLKMTVLPFMSLSLIYALGSLSLEQAKSLTKWAAVFLLVLWALTLSVVYSMTFLFPEQPVPFYHGTSALEGQMDGGLLSLFIPINPIHAFANNIIPAVVVFSLLFGIALMQLKTKAQFLGNVKVAITALVSITKWVANLSPIGVFALIAASTGTMPFRDFNKIRLYVTAYLLGSSFLSLYGLPGLVGALTPVSGRRFLRELRPAILLAFTTGNVLIALPYVIRALDEIREEFLHSDESASATIESTVPIAYNFPTVGNLFGILYILFLSFFYAHPLGLDQHFKLVFLGIPVLFGAATSVINGVAFLIDSMQLPIDGVSLFLETLPLTRNFQALCSTVGISFLAIMLAFACSRKLTINPRKLLQVLGGGAIILCLAVLGGRAIGPGKSEKKEVFSSLVLHHPLSNVTLYRPGEAPSPQRKRQDYDGLMDRIKQSGVLRVGYNAENKPFAYFNNQNQLVGYDIVFAHELARALDVHLEFHPFNYSELIEDLSSHRYDIAMSSVSVTPERLAQIHFTDVYMEMDRALIVRDYRRTEFADNEQVQAMKDLRLAVLDGSSLIAVAKQYYPDAKLILLEHTDDFLDRTDVDALLWTKEEGTTWSLIHPAYTVVIPSPDLGKEFYAYATAADSTDFMHFTNYWLDLKEKEGFSADQAEYWILGKTPDSQPRWSIIRDVLHWIE